MSKQHIDDGKGNALCGLKTRPGVERGYLGDNDTHSDGVIEGKVGVVVVTPARSYMDACSSHTRCLKCCRKYKKIHNIKD